MKSRVRCKERRPRSPYSSER